MYHPPALVTAKKMGILVPSSNTAVEAFTPSILASLPGNRILPIFTRIPVKTLDATAGTAAQFDPHILIAAAELLMDAKPDFIIWAGTSAQFLPGSSLEVDRAFADDMTTRLGVPCSTNTLAMHIALEQLGIKDISIAVPYPEALAERVSSFWESAGYNVHRTERLQPTPKDNIAIGNSSGNEMTATIKRCVTSATRAVIVPCTNWPVAPLVDELEEELQDVYILDSVVVNTWFAAWKMQAGEGLGHNQLQTYGKLWRTLAN